MQSKIGQYVVDIHHIGSTAVKGLSAKPIINIAVEIKDYKYADKKVILLTQF